MKFLIFLSLCFTLQMSNVANLYDYGLKDAFWRTLMTPFEGTLWSEDFSENEFSKIRIGMSSQEVIELIGQPISKGLNCDSICFWIYTIQDTGTADFDQRWVVFNNHLKVTEVRKSFFID